MKRLHLTLAVAVAASTAAAATFRGTDDGRVLTNPDTGLTMHYYSNVPDNYGSKIEPGDDMSWFPGCSVCYLRLPWSMIEPEEGVYDWATIDTPAQRWIAKGGQIALRFTCSEDWMYHATPKWVKDAGAKGRQYRLWAGKGPIRTPDGKTLPWDPDFGDAVFLEKLEKFIAALAARYDGRPEVAFVDIGSYGLWGEGHTFGSSQVPEAKRAVDIPRHIDLWCKYFKQTQLILSDDVDGNANTSGKYPMLDYARSKGVGWRDDSILVEPPPRSWYHADQAERYWRTLPVVLEHEHYAPSKATKAWSAERLVESVELMHASYMSIHGSPKKLLDENREAFERIARRLGYRFVPQTVTWPDAVKVGKNGETFEVSFSFANRGVAPCYRDAYPCLTVKDDKGRILAVLADGGFNLKGLLPDMDGTRRVPPALHTARFRLGRFGAPKFPVPGTFDVYLSVGEADGTPVYELPIGDDDGHRRYKIGRCDCLDRARRGALVLSFDDRNLGDWERAIPIFDKYGAHATFFCSGALDGEATRVLNLLHEHGHSIGLHGLNHQNADAAVREKGVAAYWAEEISPQLAECRAAGIPITSFAYPNCRCTDETDELFRTNGFKRVRGGLKGVAPYDPKGEKQEGLKPIHTVDRAFFPVKELKTRFRLDTVIAGEAYHTDIKDILQCIRRCAERDEVFVLTSHGIHPDAKHINMKTDWLERILATAKNCGVACLGFDELQ